MATTLSDKILLTTAEAGEVCGREIIFEELLALYGNTLLKPLRTLSNGAQTWDKRVILAVISKAQSEGTLNDRPRVDAALIKFRASRRPTVKAQADSP